MHILITGAGGFIGFELARALLEHGHQISGCVREPIWRRDPRIHYLPCDFAHDTSVAVWIERLQGVDVVINAVGIIHSREPNTFEAVHVKTPRALFDACLQTGVKRVIQISALGISESSTTAYHLSKKQADDYLMSLDLNWIILRSSWLYGRSHKSGDYLLGYAALPLLPLMAGGRDQLQPVYIDDFAQSVAEWVKADQPARLLMEVGGPAAMSFKEMLFHFRQWLGLGKPSVISLPRWLVKTLVRVSDFLFKTPLNFPSIDMLERQNITEDKRFWQIAGIQPRSLSKALALRPSEPSDYWYARLFFLLPKNMPKKQIS